MKSQNLFPSVGANGPATVHVNFGQMGFVFIEANVKKWGLAPMTGSLAPPPPYGSEQGSILLEAGREGNYVPPGNYFSGGHSRTRSGVVRGRPQGSPGPVRSPTDISLAQLEHIPSHQEGDAGEGTSGTVNTHTTTTGLGIENHNHPTAPPPEYTSPSISDDSHNDDDEQEEGGEQAPLVRSRPQHRPPIPSYDFAVGNIASANRREDRSSSRS
jgi:hypothetical protein